MSQPRESQRAFTHFQKKALLSYEDREAARKIAEAVRRKRLSDAARIAYWWVGTEGGRFSPLRWRERLVDISFDRRFGTDTETRAELGGLSIVGENAEHGVYYQASPVIATRKIIRSLPINHPDFSFVDFGSGKGRVLLLAGELPFRSVIGVEFGSELNEVARRNIDKFRNYIRAGTVQSLHEDVTRFELPTDNLVLYFYNPFDEQIVGQVLAALNQSLQVSPREVFVIYLHAGSLDQAFRKQCGFELVQRWRKFTVLRRKGE